MTIQTRQRQDGVALQEGRDDDYDVEYREEVRRKSKKHLKKQVPSKDTPMKATCQRNSQIDETKPTALPNKKLETQATDSRSESKSGGSSNKNPASRKTAELDISNSKSGSSIESDLHPIEMKARIRRRLIPCTDVDLNDRDSYGDGDQSRVTSPESQLVLHEIFYTGGDFNLLLKEHDYLYLSNQQKNYGRIALNLGGLSEFAIHCIAGHHRKIKELLEDHSMKNGKGMSALVNLLEKRETSLRLTPLMLVVAAGTRMTEEKGYDKNENGMCVTKDVTRTMKTMNIHEDDDITDPDKLRTSSDVQITTSLWEQNQLRVIKLLLEYGARPDVRDVTGKTVVHYGAGIDATEMTLAAVNMCITAAKSSFMFGREVELRNMNITVKRTTKRQRFELNKLNGMKGIAHGYVADTGSRIVYLFGQKNELRNVKPSQIKLVEKIHGQKPPCLVDIPDRMGRVPLLEIYQSNRLDVAEFLLYKHKASIDVPSAGWGSEHTLSEVVLKQSAKKYNAIEQLIYSLAIQKLNRLEKIKRNQCSQCHTVGTLMHPLRVCEPCMTVRFCSDECQLAHWRAGHMYECKHLARERNMFVQVNTESLIPNTVGQKIKGSYRKPSKAQYSEPFTVKVQYMEEEEILLIQDKTKECEFYLCMDYNDDNGYGDLLDKLRSQQSISGNGARFMYINAVFEDDIVCKLYINQSKIKAW